MHMNEVEWLLCSVHACKLSICFCLCVYVIFCQKKKLYVSALWPVNSVVVVVAAVVITTAVVSVAMDARTLFTGRKWNYKCSYAKFSHGHAEEEKKNSNGNGRSEANERRNKKKWQNKISINVFFFMKFKVSSNIFVPSVHHKIL